MSDYSSDDDSTIIIETTAVANILKKYEQFDAQPGPSTSKTKIKSKFDISDDESDDEDFGLGTPAVFKYLTENREAWEVGDEPINDKKVIDIICVDEDDTVLRTKTVDSVKAVLSKKSIEILSSSDDDDTDSKSNYNHLFLNTDPFIPNKISGDSSAESDILLSTDNISSSQNKRNRKSDADKEAKRLEKEQLKLQKQKERELKKIEAERNKEIVKVLGAAHKAKKPEECIKFMTVSLDNGLMNKPYSSSITKHLKELGSKYEEVDQIIADSITWSRKVQTHLVDDCGILQLKEDIHEEDHLMIILEATKIVELVIKKDLSVHIGSVKSIFGNKRISLGIYDMSNYFKSKKSVASKPTKKAKTDIDYTDVPKISKGDLEYALTELQLLCDCCCRFVETPEELGLMVMQFTKSVAMIPFKMDKNDKLKQAAWFIEGDNKDSVKVDKDGNGLQRLWQQHLTSFPLARLETAETIMSKYPTVSSLMEAYNMCSTENEKTQLLKNLPIRRAAGPLSGGRNLGPELSKKMCTFYNSTNGDDLL